MAPDGGKEEQTLRPPEWGTEENKEVNHCFKEQVT